MKHIYQDETGTIHFDRYFAYLESVKHKMPKALHEFASDQSRYSLRDRKSMHDAWLVTISISERADSSDDPRYVFAALRLLGPYHDRFFDIDYKRVSAYSIAVPQDRDTLPSVGHGDVLYQEFLLMNDVTLSHEIRFSSGGRIYIECDDIAINETLIA